MSTAWMSLAFGVLVMVFGFVRLSHRGSKDIALGSGFAMWGWALTTPDASMQRQMMLAGSLMIWTGLALNLLWIIAYIRKRSFMKT